MNTDVLTLPLLDFLQYKAGCTYLSDLRYISGWQKVQLPTCWRRSPQRRRTSIPGTSP